MNYSDITLTADMLLNKTTVLFGSSGSGKTIFMKHILHILKDVIDNIIIVSQTELSNGSFESIVPKICIHTDLTQDLIETISDRQKALSKTYKASNTHDVIYNLYKHLPKNDQIIDAIEKTEKFRAKKIKEIEGSKKNADIKTAEIKEINKQVEDLTKQIYKKYILHNEIYLTKQKTLTKDELKYLKYLGATPYFIFVLDDCASSFAKFVKKKEFLELFYQGRHLNITLLISCQDDTDLTPQIRKNIYINIFTSAETARSYFDRSKQAKHIKNSISNTVQNVFVKNQKLLYFRENPPDKQFYTSTAKIHPNLRFGSDQLYKLIEAVGTDEDVTNTKFDNIFNE